MSIISSSSAIRERDRLRSLQNLFASNEIITAQYNAKKNFVILFNEQLKAAFESNRIESAAGDARKTWQLFKEVLFNQTTKFESSVTINGTPITDSFASCDAVNDYFCTAGENLVTDIIASHGYDIQDIDNLYPNWSFQHVSSDTVAHTVINSLPNKKSTSFDKVLQHLKSTVLRIALLITTCFNTMIDSSNYPAELLKGKLKLIHKSGGFDIEHFRGLTLLPSLSRVFEELLIRQLYAYLSSLNLFIGNQFGFLKNSSCLSAAFQLVDLIKLNFRKTLITAMFIDLKKAFDTVDPIRLVRKLKRLGKMDLIGQLILYADDAATIYALDSAEAMQHAMQHDADLRHEWLCRNVLSINTVKTCYATFGMMV